VRAAGGYLAEQATATTEEIPMIDRWPSTARTSWVVSVLSVLLGAAAPSAASEFPKEICGSPPIWTQEVPVPEGVDGTYGVAFSGGGSRSAAATLGQLRGLHLTGALPAIGYISAVSGGAWAATPYTYLQGDDQEIAAFLSRADYRPPGELSDSCLKEEKESSFAKVLNGAGWFLTKAPWALLRGKGNETWSDAVGRELLKPFGLYSRESLFGWTEPVGEVETTEVKTTLLDARRRHIPYLLIGGTVKCGFWSFKKKVPLEISPHYTGILPGIPSRPKCPASVYVETHTFDNRPASDNQCAEDLQSYRIEKKKDLFTLSDALGITSSAPGLWLPKGTVFQTAIMKTTDGWDNFRVRDGGDTDNLGLLPLLARQVPNITVFVNAKRPIEKDCSGKECKWRKAITSYFEFTGDKKTGFIGEADKEEHANDAIAAVFAGNGSALIEALAQKKRDEEIPYHCDSFTISDRNQIGLPSSYSPRVCWVYLDRTEKWARSLLNTPDSLMERLRNGERPYKSFPHYSTFLAEGSRIQAADLDKKEILAMGQLTTWTVCQIAKDLFPGAAVQDCPEQRGTCE
jgi:hypothetical protein